MLPDGEVDLNFLKRSVMNKNEINVTATCIAALANQPNSEDKIKLLKPSYKEISYMYFDLFVEELNLAIEYDGKCHIEPIDWASKGEEWAIENLRYLHNYAEISK